MKAVLKSAEILYLLRFIFKFHHTFNDSSPQLKLISLLLHDETKHQQANTRYTYNMKVKERFFIRIFTASQT